MDFISRNAIQHTSMVLDLAIARAITNHTSRSRIDMQDLLRLETEIAFDELKSEHGWAWNDLQELREAHHRCVTENEKKIMKNLEREIKKAERSQ